MTLVLIRVQDSILCRSLMYQCIISRYNLYTSKSAGTAKNRVMGWLTDDMKWVVRELTSGGLYSKNTIFQDLIQLMAMLNYPANGARDSGIVMGIF